VIRSKLEYLFEIIISTCKRKLEYLFEIRISTGKRKPVEDNHIHR
jgi:hypothetical protein